MARVPSYRRHKASGQAIVTLGGRDFYLVVHNSAESRHKYQRLLGEYLVAGKPSTFGVAPDELVISEILVRFLQYAKAYYGGSIKPISATIFG